MRVTHMCVCVSCVQVPLAEAGPKCRHPWMREALQAWIVRQGWQHQLPAANAGPAEAPSRGCSRESSSD
jgi:hypothetical protein